MKKIHAVSDSDLDGLIESLGLAESLKKGLLSCGNCGKALSRENIGCVYPQKNEIRLCCNTLDCLQKTLETITPLRRVSNGGEENNES